MYCLLTTLVEIFFLLLEHFFSHFSTILTWYLSNTETFRLEVSTYCNKKSSVEEYIAWLTAQRIFRIKQEFKKLHSDVTDEKFRSTDGNLNGLQDTNKHCKIFRNVFP